MSACIYCIENIVNGHCYIGQTKNYNARISKHKRELKSKKHHCLPLQRAFEKYGEENFIFYKLEEVDDYAFIKEKEDFWINKKGYYNICGGRNGFTPTALRNFSESHLGQVSSRRLLSETEVYYCLALSEFLDGTVRTLSNLSKHSRVVFKEIINRKTYKEISNAFDNFSFEKKLVLLNEAISYYKYDVWKNTNCPSPKKNKYLFFLLNNTPCYDKELLPKITHMSKGGLRKAALEFKKDKRQLDTTFTDEEIKRILFVLIEEQYRAKLAFLQERVETIPKGSRVEMSHSKRQSSEMSEEIVQQ